MKLATFSPISNQAANSSALPTRLKVLNFGSNQTLDEPIIVNTKTYKQLPVTQKETGGERIQIDFNHNTVPGSKAYEAEKEPRAIAAYGVPEVDNDGVWLKDIEWTDTGRKHALDYYDLSPAVILDENNIVIGLHSVALTPKGAIKDLTFYSADNIFISTKSAQEHDMKQQDNDNDDNDNDHGPDCECESCMDAEDGDAFDKDVFKKHLEEYDQEDHFSKYGDVDYADKENHKYPIDSDAHVRAAWSYINMPKNAKKYSGDKLSQIKSRIKAAMNKHGIEVGDEEKTKTKAMSADFRMPDAYENTLPREVEQAKKNMIETFKALSPKFGNKSEAEILEILKNLVAKWEGEDGVEGPITNKENSKVHEFSAEFEKYEKRIAALEAKNEAETARHAEIEKASIIAQASRDGKVLPSQKVIQSLSAENLKELVDGLPKATVPTRSNMKVLSSDNNNKANKPTMADASRLLNEIVAATMNNRTPSSR